MDVGRLHGLGWKHKIGLREGITQVYEAYKKYEGAKV
jgi:nucleoside-diphosphate-sugar epimerase